MSEDAPSNASPATSGEVTNLLVLWSQGDHSALKQLTPIIYDDLLRLARGRLRREYGDYTLEPAGLVHEAYLRLADQSKVHAHNRLHFYAIAANTMRRVLVEHARKRQAHKRGGGIRVTLQPEMSVAEERTPDFLALDESLRRLADMDERKSRAIELKFFGGLNVQEISLMLKVSVATVGRELRLGQAWIRRDMSSQANNSDDEE